jgi:hypothetical protein
MVAVANQQSASVSVLTWLCVPACTCRGSTPLHFAAAAKQNALAVCQLLIASGANPGQPDFHGYLPYEQAEQPEVRVLLGGPDQRLFDYAGEGATHSTDQQCQ